MGRERASGGESEEMLGWSQDVEGPGKSPADGVVEGEGRDGSGHQQGEVREGRTDQGVETQTGLGRGSAREPSPT